MLRSSTSGRSGMRSLYHGLGQWNGVAIASRVGISDVPARAFRPPTAGPIWAATPGRHLRRRPRGEHLRAERARWSALSSSSRSSSGWTASTSGSITQCDPTAPRGRSAAISTSPPADDDVYDPVAVHGGTHVSPREREAVARGCGNGGWSMWCAASIPSPGFFTWWDYRGGELPQEPGDADRPCHATEAARRAGSGCRTRPRNTQAVHLPGDPVRPRPSGRRLRRSGLGSRRSWRLHHRHFFGRRTTPAPLEDLLDLADPHDRAARPRGR